MSEVGILGCKHPSLEKYIKSCKKKAIYRGKLPKKGGFRQFADLRGGWGKRGDGVFDRGGGGGGGGWYLNTHYTFSSVPLF